MFFFQFSISLPRMFYDLPRAAWSCQIRSLLQVRVNKLMPLMLPLFTCAKIKWLAAGEKWGSMITQLICELSSHWSVWRVGKGHCALCSHPSCERHPTIWPQWRTPEQLRTDGFEWLSLAAPLQTGHSEFIQPRNSITLSHNVAIFAEIFYCFLTLWAGIFTCVNIVT